MSDRQRFPSEAAERFQVRLPDGLRDRIKAAAEANNRSMNAEIVARLQGVIDPDAEGWVRVWLPPDLIERIEEKAASVPTTAETEIRFALEEAFPRTPTVAEQFAAMRRRLEAMGDKADPKHVGFVAGVEAYIAENPEFGAEPLLKLPEGYEMGPEE